MSGVTKQLVAGALRYAVRLVLQRPWLKSRIREMITRAPRLHSFLLRVMFQVPASSQSKINVDHKNLSPHARRVHRALKQAARSERR